MNVYFGDICVPWLTSKDTSIDREVVEKNFVDSPPQVFELIPNLEAGSYSAILNETVQDKNESFEEQIDAVLSMPSRHATEFPVEVAGDKGHVVVETSSTTTFPSKEVREAEMEIRFTDHSNYGPAVSTKPFAISDAYSPTPVESLYPIASTENVLNKTPQFTITTEDGDLDYYLYSSSEVIEYERDTTEFSLGERIAPVRLYDTNDLRIYSDMKAVGPGTRVENSLIRIEHNSSTSTVEYYDGTWKEIGDIDFGVSDGYPMVNENEQVLLEFVSGDESSVFKGYPLVQIDFSSKTSISLTPTENITVADDSQDWYQTVTMDSSGYELIIIKTSTDGSLSNDSTSLSWDSIGSSNEYTAFVGAVPSQVSASDYARYVYNRGSWRRSLTQR